MGKQTRFSSPRVARFKRNTFYQFIFAPKEVNATKRYEIIVHSSHIQAQLLAIQYVLAEGTLLINLTPYDMLFMAEFHPWNDEAFEILSTAIDELTVLLIRFRALYPTETFINHLTMDQEPCAPI